MMSRMPLERFNHWNPLNDYSFAFREIQIALVADYGQLVRDILTGYIHLPLTFVPSMASVR